MDGLFISQMQQKEKVNLDQFKMISLLGKGNYAKVVQVRYLKNDKIYAMKIIKKRHDFTKQQEERIKLEKKILTQVDCEFVIKMHFAFQNEKNLYLVLEYCPGGEFFRYLNKTGILSEKNCKFYAAQLVLGIEYLHSQGIIYRDLKPENVLIDLDGYIKLADFGLSKEKKDNEEQTYSMVGTIEYLAPEVLFRQGHGKAVDWWTLGTIIYEMVQGQSPFYDENKQQIIEKIKYNQFKYRYQVSPELQDLLNQLLVKEQKNRLGYYCSEHVINHKWFRDIDWNKLRRKEIVPEFKPFIRSDTDTHHFDKNFTQQDCISPSFTNSNFKSDHFQSFYYERDTLSHNTNYIHNNNNNNKSQDSQYSFVLTAQDHYGNHYQLDHQNSQYQNYTQLHLNQQNNIQIHIKDSLEVQEQYIDDITILNKEDDNIIIIDDYQPNIQKDYIKKLK